MIKMINILIVDDSRLARMRIKETINTLKLKHTIVGEASNGIEALEIFKNQPVNLLIVDLEMPQMNGLELIEEIRKENKDLFIIVISSIDNQQARQKLQNDKYLNFLKKPFNIKLLEDIILKIEHRIT